MNPHKQISFGIIYFFISGMIFLNPVELTGKRIVLERSYPPRINHIKLKIHLPAGCKFLPAADSRLKLFTQAKKLIRSYKITQLDSIFKVDRKIPSNRLYAQMSLYYCQEGNEALCLMKNILFEIPLAKQENNRLGADVDLNCNIETNL